MGDDSPQCARTRSLTFHDGPLSMICAREANVDQIELGGGDRLLEILCRADGTPDDSDKGRDTLPSLEDTVDYVSTLGTPNVKVRIHWPTNHAGRPASV